MSGRYGGMDGDSSDQADKYRQWEERGRAMEEERSSDDTPTTALPPLGGSGDAYKERAWSDVDISAYSDGRAHNADDGSTTVMPSVQDAQRPQGSFSQEPEQGNFVQQPHDESVMDNGEDREEFFDEYGSIEPDEEVDWKRYFMISCCALAVAVVAAIGFGVAYSHARSEVSDYSGQVASSAVDGQSKDRALHSARMDSDRANKDIERLKKERDDARKKISDANKDASELRDKVASLEQAKSDAERRSADAQSAKDELSDKDEEISRLKDSVSSLRSDLNDARSNSGNGDSAPTVTVTQPAQEAPTVTVTKPAPAAPTVTVTQQVPVPADGGGAATQ